MTAESEPEQTFPSTTWAYEMRKIKRRPQGTTTATPKASRWRGLARWPRQRPVRITISHKGGAESWWWLETRGRKGAFPGWLALEDVMSAVLNEYDHDPSRTFEDRKA